jgi:ferredoxin, 2Fe-2S
MPKVTFVSFNGTEHVVDVPVGTTGMQAAVDSAVPGIDADCGGQAACGTCHVFVDAAWLTRTGSAGTETERQMLQFAENAQQNSRLACQIVIDESLDGLVLRLPDGQH